MKTAATIAILLAACGVFAADYVTPVVTKNETVTVKTQSRVTRIEIIYEAKSVRFISRFINELEVAGQITPSKEVVYERLLPANAADTVTVGGIKLTREQLAAFARAFAEADSGVVAVASSDVKLKWKDNSVNEVAFEIERSVDGGPFVVVGSAPKNAQAFTDIPTAPFAKVSYRVRASNSGGKSGYSNVVSVP